MKTATPAASQRPPNGLGTASFEPVLPSSSTANWPLAQRQPLNGLQQQSSRDENGGGRLALPDFPAGLLSEEDLEGGRLLSMEEVN